MSSETRCIDESTPEDGPREDAGNQNAIWFVIGIVVLILNLMRLGVV